MAHSYTARQLDFFKSTLKIIESALFEAESVAITQQSDQSAPAAIESAPSIVAVEQAMDSHSISRALFSVMPLPDELQQSSVTLTAIEPAVISVTHVQNSKAFFSELPWQTVINKPAPVSYNAPAPAKPAVSVIASVTPPNSSAFFKAMPWQVQPSTAAAINQSPQPIASVIDTSQPALTTTPDNSCMNFFTHAPWQGQLASNTSDDLHSDEFATIAQLATQSALTAAKRGVNQASAPTATRFFQALPW